MSSVPRVSDAMNTSIRINKMDSNSITIIYIIVTIITIKYLLNAQSE